MEAPFRANIEGVLALAEERSTPVLLISFAYFIPDHYDEVEAAGGDHGFAEPFLHGAPCPVATWGKTQNVALGIERHNAIARDLASKYEHVTLVDYARLAPKSGKYFIDACHLSEEGCRLMAGHIVDAALHRLNEPGDEPSR